MAILKKSAAPTPYIVPSLEDVDPDYAALVSRRAELLGRQNELNAEHRALSKAIKADTTPSVRPGVAALLGDADSPDSRAVKSQRLAIVAGQLRDIDTAVEVLRQRIATARTHASVAVCNAVRPEYSRRVAAVAKALEALAAVRADYDEMRDQFEAQDIAWGYLGAVSLGFLGDPRDGHIPRFLRDAREAGHVK